MYYSREYLLKGVGHFSHRSYLIMNLADAAAAIFVYDY